MGGEVEGGCCGKTSAEIHFSSISGHQRLGRLCLNFTSPAALPLHGGAVLLNDKRLGELCSSSDGLRMNQVLTVRGWRGWKG